MHTVPADTDDDTSRSEKADEDDSLSETEQQESAYVKERNARVERNNAVLRDLGFERESETKIQKGAFVSAEATVFDGEEPGSGGVKDRRSRGLRGSKDLDESKMRR